MLEIQESYVNLTDGHRFGDSGWYKPYTDNLGVLYRAMRKEYGRCTSKVYIDPASGREPIQVGWVFVKRMEYEDAYRIRDKEKRTYLREVWVSYRQVNEQTDEGGEA